MIGLVIGAIALASAALYIALQSVTQPEQTEMEPNSLDSFSVTKAQEGTVVPYVVGENRITGNFLWYGNLITEKVTEWVETGGKGGGGGGRQEVTKGYNYYMDMWQGICLGPGVVVDAIYVNDTKRGAFGSLNDGGGSFFPTAVGLTKTSRLSGVAHCWFDRYFLGFNVSQVPTFHYIVNRSITEFPYSQYLSVAHGQNPAAIVWDILIRGGASAADMNASTFEDAAEYWYNKGYGLSFNFYKQQKIKEHIRRVLAYVDGAFYIDGDDKFNLVAFKETDTYDVIVPEEDFQEFNFSRRSWDDVASDYRGNYIDRDQDFTKRSLRSQNVAVAMIAGRSDPVSIDLTGFTDVTAASKRLFEIMKKMSYPEATITCKLPTKYIEYNVGQIIRFSYSDYGIVSADFRIVSKSISGIEDNWVGFQLTEMVDGLFDDNYDIGSDVSWENPVYEPQPVVHQRVIELPYNSFGLENPTHLILMQREGSETGATLTVSQSGTDYTIKADITTWSQHGTLAALYAKNTITIDDDIGPLISLSHREDPVFETIDRSALFTTPRLLIINDEIMCFQTVAYEGDNLRLKGVIRGLFNTAQVQHAVDSEVWMVPIGDNVVFNINYATFYAKLLPYFGGYALSAGDATPVSGEYTQLALKPKQFAAGYVIRAASSEYNFELHPIRKSSGAGVSTLESQSDNALALADDESIEYKFYETTTNIYTATGYVFTLTSIAGNYMYVRFVKNGVYGEWQQLLYVYNMSIGEERTGPDF